MSLFWIQKQIVFLRGLKMSETVFTINSGFQTEKVLVFNEEKMYLNLMWPSAQ